MGRGFQSGKTTKGHSLTRAGGLCSKGAACLPGLCRCGVRWSTVRRVQPARGASLGDGGRGGVLQHSPDGGARGPPRTERGSWAAVGNCRMCRPRSVEDAGDSAGCFGGRWRLAAGRADTALAAFGGGNAFEHRGRDPGLHAPAGFRWQSGRDRAGIGLAAQRAGRRGGGGRHGASVCRVQPPLGGTRKFSRMRCSARCRADCRRCGHAGRGAWAGGASGDCAPVGAVGAVDTVGAGAGAGGTMGGGAGGFSMEDMLRAGQTSVKLNSMKIQFRNSDA
ncbi:Uncharacterised protein [Comamonas aquatica]|jgi:hypothetical protein|uniref:Uncharacterized protein n=1 Tax=Comamonas aquatica TaxID=225991 RepID=A0AA35GG94_9BURK|nr:Uncharacterised protein [Comamonas aquatica]CAB5697017.1 Uncharacterised protein [Comamonas aquatica]CAC9189842.1 Uncharacterised protein [Comamonas aquatica]CAC9691241.1 Uncharacterised protein [Comamonas aquatica]